MSESDDQWLRCQSTIRKLLHALGNSLPFDAHFFRQLILRGVIVREDGKTIYVGGYFGRLGRKSRANLAAVDARSGSVRRCEKSARGLRR